MRTTSATSLASDDCSGIPSPAAVELSTATAARPLLHPAHHLCLRLETLRFAKRVCDGHGRISDWCKQRSEGILPASPYAGERPPKVISAPIGDAPTGHSEEKKLLTISETRYKKLALELDQAPKTTMKIQCLPMSDVEDFMSEYFLFDMRNSEVTTVICWRDAIRAGRLFGPHSHLRPKVCGNL